MPRTMCIAHGLLDNLKSRKQCFIARIISFSVYLLVQYRCYIRSLRKVEISNIQKRSQEKTHKQRQKRQQASWTKAYQSRNKKNFNHLKPLKLAHLLLKNATRMSWAYAMLICFDIITSSKKISQKIKRSIHSSECSTTLQLPFSNWISHPLSSTLVGHDPDATHVSTEHLLVGGWTTHLNNMLVKLDHFPGFRGENKKNVWNHQLPWTPKTHGKMKGFFSTPNIWVK